MDDRNRRDRMRRDTEQNRRSPDYLGSRQAEQFDDSTSYAQDDGWSDSEQYGRQRGERARPVGLYYEEYVVRAPRRDRQREERDDSEALAARNERFGPARYDNGSSYYTSESQGGRDFSGPSRLGGYGGFGSGAGSSSSGFARPQHSDRPRTRDWWDRTTDEVASWFGDDEAARRRKMDHRGHGPSDYTRSDDRIREDINDNLTDDWAVDARKVSVKVENGEVTLSGTVPTRLQKRRAEDCAEEASGVKHVQNNLRVEESSSPGASG
jgi:osmotically-inducible protein OsmY